MRSPDQCLDILHAEGFTTTAPVRRGKHYRVDAEYNGAPYRFTLIGSASDHRAYKNYRAQVRRIKHTLSTNGELP